jgi:hypothetical protein
MLIVSCIARSVSRWTFAALSASASTAELPITNAKTAVKKILAFMDSPRGGSHHTPKCVLLRIASYAEMRIPAPGLRKKIRCRTMQLKRRPDLQFYEAAPIGTSVTVRP